jgi:hypothetical protein
LTKSGDANTLSEHRGGLWESIDFGEKGFGQGPVNDIVSVDASRARIRTVSGVSMMMASYSRDIGTGLLGFSVQSANGMMSIPHLGTHVTHPHVQDPND